FTAQAGTQGLGTCPGAAGPPVAVGSGGLCAVTAVGLALTLVLIALVDSGPTAWSAGAGGVAALGSGVLLVRRERTALRPMTDLGRIGIGFVVLVALGLLGAGVLFVLGVVAVAELVSLLCLAPTLLAMVFLGTELARGVSGDGPSIDSQMRSIYLG